MHHLPMKAPARDESDQTATRRPGLRGDDGFSTLPTPACPLKGPASHMDISVLVKEKMFLDSLTFLGTISGSAQMKMLCLLPFEIRSFGHTKETDMRCCQNAGFSSLF